MSDQSPESKSIIQFDPENGWGMTGKTFVTIMNFMKEAGLETSAFEVAKVVGKFYDACDGGFSERENP